MDNTLTLLAAKYENRALIHAHEIYQVISPPPKNPKRTAIEAISRGEFPVQTLKINGRRYVRLVDLAAMIDGTSALDNVLNNQPRRAPGRPRKIAGATP